MSAHWPVDMWNYLRRNRGSSQPSTSTRPQYSPFVYGNPSLPYDTSVDRDLEPKRSNLPSPRSPTPPPRFATPPRRFVTLPRRSPSAPSRSQNETLPTHVRSEITAAQVTQRTTEGVVERKTSALTSSCHPEAFCRDFHEKMNAEKEAAAAAARAETTTIGNDDLINSEISCELQATDSTSVQTLESYGSQKSSEVVNNDTDSERLVHHSIESATSKATTVGSDDLIDPEISSKLQTTDNTSVHIPENNAAQRSSEAGNNDTISKSPILSSIESADKTSSSFGSHSEGVNLEETKTDGNHDLIDREINDELQNMDIKSTPVIIPEPYGSQRSSEAENIDYKPADSKRPLLHSIDSILGLNKKVIGETKETADKGRQGYGVGVLDDVGAASRESNGGIVNTQVNDGVQDSDVLENVVESPRKKIRRGHAIGEVIKPDEENSRNGINAYSMRNVNRPNYRVMTLGNHRKSRSTSSQLSLVATTTTEGTGDIPGTLDGNRLTESPEVRLLSPTTFGGIVSPGNLKRQGQPENTEVSPAKKRNTRCKVQKATIGSDAAAYSEELVQPSHVSDVVTSSDEFVQQINLVSPIKKPRGPRLEEDVSSHDFLMPDLSPALSTNSEKTVELNDVTKKPRGTKSEKSSPTMPVLDVNVLPIKKPRVTTPRKRGPNRKTPIVATSSEEFMQMNAAVSPQKTPRGKRSRKVALIQVAEAATSSEGVVELNDVTKNPSGTGSSEETSSSSISGLDALVSPIKKLSVTTPRKRGPNRKTHVVATNSQEFMLMNALVSPQKTPRGKRSRKVAPIQVAEAATSSEGVVELNDVTKNPSGTKSNEETSSSTMPVPDAGVSPVKKRRVATPRKRGPNREAIEVPTSSEEFMQTNAAVSPQKTPRGKKSRKVDPVQVAGAATSSEELIQMNAVVLPLKTPKGARSRKVDPAQIADAGVVSTTSPIKRPRTPKSPATPIGTKRKDMPMMPLAAPVVFSDSDFVGSPKKDTDGGNEVPPE